MNEIPGLALGIVKNNQIIFEKYYGVEDLDSPKKVDKNSMFRIYSTTKLISNVAVFQLIENGKISLEDSISMYLENLPTEWQNVKIKNLLSHSSGIPDFIQYNDISTLGSNQKIIDRLAKEKMEFETGNEYRYNQTNYWLLAMIVEKITQQSFEDFILKNQFSDAQNQAILSSNSLEKIPNRVQKYNRYDDATKKYTRDLTDEGKRSVAANGLAITLPAFLKWSIHFSKNDFLKSETKRMMWKPFEYKNRTDFFGYGWEISRVNNIYSYGFSGGNVSAFKIFPDNDLTIIIMYNGNKSFPVQYQAINHIAGLIDPKLRDPYLFTEEAITSGNLIHSNAKKETYGYRIENGTIIFSYQLPGSLKTSEINSFSVAGSFNNWNPENQSYQMAAKKGNTFELALPESQFEKGKTYLFKFVMNKTGWLPTPNNVINTDGTPDNNLTLRID
ncbi:CubicO group peptidase (beta-lactamase class C family) [Chryseobacterium shigense]|uniref:CubicO group peptidase (Beta-lactamase class C family) n=2 Tax=Chryseobacterium shigense TaxID=297244 RepID=A0A841N8T1_9FLAO|nr:CubicO group peptidase (beta-lactamase class C family) [Chryseobacterium shigense]